MLGKAIVEYAFSSEESLRMFLKKFCVLRDSECKLLKSTYLRKLLTLFEKKGIGYFKNLKAFQEEGYKDFLPSKISPNFRRSVTLNGYSFDVVKSAFQKYTRRGEQEAALYFMIEARSFWLVGAKSQTTNFLNRLRVIALEDVGISSPHVLLKVHENICSLERREDFLCPELYMISCLLSNTLHSRTYSVVNRYYPFEEDKDLLEGVYPPQKRGEIKESYLYRHVDALFHLLSVKDPKAWCVARMLIKLEDSKVKTDRKYYGSTKPGFLALAIISKFLTTQVQKDVLQVCSEWYKTMKNKERVMCIFYPMYLYILEDKILEGSPEGSPSQEESASSLRYPANLLGEIRNVDSYCLDRHTLEGRGKGDGDFALEGALVAYEDMSLGLEDHKLTYIQHKTCGYSRTESSLFTLKVRAQLTCSNSKTDTYFATYSLTGEAVVVKGPYLNVNSVQLSYNLLRLAKFFPCVNVPKVNLVLAIPDLFQVPIGVRTKIGASLCIFQAFEDLFYTGEPLPIEIRSSKVWKDEPVFDYAEFFRKNPGYNYAYPTLISEAACVSLIYQVYFRLLFRIGDFAARNFLVVGDKAYNIDVEGFGIGDKIRWAAKECSHLSRVYAKHREEIRNTLISWEADICVEHPSLYSKWHIIQRCLGISLEEVAEIRNRLHDLIDTPPVQV